MHSLTTRSLPSTLNSHLVFRLCKTACSKMACLRSAGRPVEMSSLYSSTKSYKRYADREREKTTYDVNAHTHHHLLSIHFSEHLRLTAPGHTDCEGEHGRSRSFECLAPCKGEKWSARPRTRDQGGVRGEVCCQRGRTQASRTKTYVKRTALTTTSRTRSARAAGHVHICENL